MANLILPSRWTRQPQGAVEIDPVYEIFSVVNPGAALLDQRTGIFPTLTNAVPGVNSAGRTIDVAAGRVFYSEPTYAADSDAFTAILQVQVVAASSNWGVMCLRESNAKGWYLNRNYNNQNIVQFSGTGSVTTPKFVSEPVTFVIEYSGGIAAIYANGKLCGSVTKALIFIHNYAGLRLGGDASDTVSQSASLFAQTKRIGFDCESLSANPWQIFKKRPHILYFDVASGGATTSTIGQSTETDTAQPVGKTKYKAIGQASTTDVAQAITAARRVAIGQASESDSAQALTASKAKQVGQASEADSAAAITPLGTLAATLNQAQETNAAHAITASPRRLLAQVSETDSAQAIAPSKTVAVAQAAETDSAQAIEAATTQKLVAVGQAQETGVAMAMSSRKSLAVGIVTETEFAQAIAHYKAAGVLQAVEADSAHSIAFAGIRAVNTASGLDVAMPMTAIGGSVVSPKAALSGTAAKVTLTSSGSKAGLTGVGTYADLTQTTQF